MYTYIVRYDIINCVCVFEDENMNDLTILYRRLLCFGIFFLLTIAPNIYMMLACLILIAIITCYILISFDSNHYTQPLIITTGKLQNKNNISTATIVVKNVSNKAIESYEIVYNSFIYYSESYNNRHDRAYGKIMPGQITRITIVIDDIPDNAVIVSVGIVYFVNDAIWIPSDGNNIEYFLEKS